MLPTAPPVTAAWIAAHLPPRYDEILGGTTNTFTVTYTADGCALHVSVAPSWNFNTAGSDDHSSAYSVKGDTLIGKRLQTGDGGDGTIDFALIDPQSLRVSRVDEFLGTERVKPTGFEFTYRNENDAKQMLAAMESVVKQCASAPSPAPVPTGTQP